MTVQTIESAIYEQLEKLSLEQRRQVLEFARSLATPKIQGVPGRSLLRFAGIIDGADLEELKQAVEEGCEQIHPNDW